MKKSVYLLPNLCTTGNFFCGLLAIFLALNGQGLIASWLIFVGMAFDCLDGVAARMKNATSDFGVQYDSLTDLVSFGIAPAVIVLQEGLKNTGRVGFIVAFLYCVCVALRLARYNVEAPKASTSSSSGGKADFRGLPSPAAAGFVAGFIIASYSLDYAPLIVRVLPVFMLVVAWLMVSNVRYPALTPRLFASRRPFFFLVTTVLLITVVVFQIEYFMLVLFSGYMILGLAGHYRAAFAPDARRFSFVQSVKKILHPNQKSI